MSNVKPRARIRPSVRPSLPRPSVCPRPRPSSVHPSLVPQLPFLNEIHRQQLLIPPPSAFVCPSLPLWPWDSWEYSRGSFLDKTGGLSRVGNDEFVNYGEAVGN